MSFTARTLRRGFAATATILVLATGTACAGSEGKPSTAAPSQAGRSGDPSGADGVKFAACMRDNGVPVDDPKPGEPPQIPGGTPQSALDKAEKACGKAPAGQAQSTGADPSVKNDPDVQALRLKLDKCLRENGFEPPKPDAKGNVTMRFTPEYEAAMKACKSVDDELGKKIDKLMEEGGRK
ncbi:hypothetical protein OG589_23260 [Sphaerisporangium sp. NBC_01403]|uniref:hypothetical protein n=1 Tax=Sphaerisporangium sp. NBC_01403 TaxID=2903599 RepID=UPI003249CCC1